MDIETDSDTPNVPETPETQDTAPPPPVPGVDPRRRLRDLLSIAERDRTDAQLDEINELEIQLAPGNRAPPGTVPGSGNPRPPFPQNQKKRPQKNDKLGGKGRRTRKPQL